MKKSFLILFICFAVLLIAQAAIGRSVWMDEAYSVLYAKQSVEKIIQPADVHPPGFYLVLHYWIGIFGDNEFAMRMLSVVFALGVFCLLYFIWVKLFKDDSFFFFGLMYVLASSVIYFATEIRMYELALFFCLLSFYSLLNFDKKIFKVLFVVATAILPYLHYFTAFFVAFELVFCFMFKRKETLKYWVMSFIMMIPSFVYFFAQMSRIGSLGFQKSSFVSVLSTYYYAWFYSPGEVSIVNTVFGLIFIVLAFYVITRYLLNEKNKSEGKLSLLMLLWFISAPLVMMLVNNFVLNVYHHRLFFFISWFFIFLTARAFSKAEYKSAAIFVFFMMLFIVWNLSLILTQYSDISTWRSANFMNYMGCSETSVIVHETQFSNLPHIWYNEQHGCYQNYLMTDLNQKELNAIGGNVIPEGRVLHELSELDGFKSFYYVLGAGRIYSDNFDYERIYLKDGIEIYLAERKW
jgi:uncharacterized membrane protein